MKRKLKLNLNPSHASCLFPQWNKQEIAIASNGASIVRYAISEHDGVILEMSMHDATIQSMVPRTHWLLVQTAQVPNARIYRNGGSLIVLCGLGKPNDPLGNLILFRVANRPGFCPVRLADTISLIFLTLDGLGIRTEDKMMDALRGN